MNSHLTIICWPLQSGLCPHHHLSGTANATSSRHSASLEYEILMIAFCFSISLLPLLFSTGSFWSHYFLFYTDPQIPRLLHFHKLCYVIFRAQDLSIKMPYFSIHVDFIFSGVSLVGFQALPFASYAILEKLYFCWVFVASSV